MTGHGPLGEVYPQRIYAPIWHWRTAMLNDFKARMDWYVQPYAKANHRPHAVLNGDSSDAIIRRTARPGETLKFDASDSTDPDTDTLRFVWWIHPEAGRQPYGKAVPIADASAAKIAFAIPNDAAGKELHLILEVWDRSEIVPLVACRRAVITVASQVSAALSDTIHNRANNPPPTKNLRPDRGRIALPRAR